jgi:Flp pilus assembly protein TadB
METLLLLAVLICPIVMGAMMVWMTVEMRRQARRDREGEQR